MKIAKKIRCDLIKIFFCNPIQHLVKNICGKSTSVSTLKRNRINFFNELLSKKTI